MKDERKIVIRNVKLQKIRNNLRQILIRALYDEIEILGNYANLYGTPLDIPPEEEVELYFLQGTRHKLFSLLRRSICKCPICTNNDRDMVYIELHDEWYCVECQKNDRIWFPAHGSEEDRWQHDYINYYYELKEKFTNKYLNKEKKITEN